MKSLSGWFWRILKDFGWFWRILKILKRKRPCKVDERSVSLWKHGCCAQSDKSFKLYNRNLMKNCISTFDKNKRCCPHWISYEDGHVHLPDVADTGLAVLAVLGVFKAASIVPGCFDFCGCCFGITLLSRLFTTIVVFFEVILVIPGRPASLPGLLTCGFLNNWLTIFIFSNSQIT